ncbi:MAG: hypothetical protein RIQ60_2744 [Pseudomonadota bacterium]|jgi:hypothetical protein
MPYFSIIRHTPGLRIAGLALLLFGAYAASVHPFQSLIGIQQIGLSPADYALVMVLASAVSVSSSVLLGIWGDRLAQRRALVIATTSVGTLGLALMLLVPSRASFVICHGIAVPITASLYGQYFALIRLSLTPRPEARTAVVTALRSCMSGSFLAALVVWNAYLRQGGELMHIYAGAFAVSAVTTLAMLLWWPRDGQAHWQDEPSGLTLMDALAEMARPAIRWRLLFMGAISSVTTLLGMLLPLIFAASPTRTPGDGALYWGIVAGWEVPVMLALPLWGRHLSRSRLITLGGLGYGCHLVLMQWLVDSPAVWGLTLLGGASGAVIFSLQISYLQDLLHERPGTAVALLAVQKLAGDLMASAAFALGAAWGGYHVTALLGGALGCLGAFSLMLADRHAEPQARNAGQADVAG